jgi:hypothetical protein
LVTGTVPRSPDRGSYRQSMSKQYLILIEQLVREGKSEREIDLTVRQAVAEDERADQVDLSADDEPAHLRAA